MSDAPAPDAPATGVLVAGETVVDFIPDRPGPIPTVERFSRRAGGAPANLAVALARLDRTPGFRTRIGTDPFGDFLVDRLAAEGLPDRYVERDPGAKTTLAFVSLDPDADRAFSFHRERPADARMEAGAVTDATLDALSWVAVGGIAFATEPSRSTLLDLAARARDRGCTVVLDPNERPELWADDEFAATMARAIEHADVVTGTADELRSIGLSGATPAALAAALLDADAGPHTVVLTRGGAGAYARAGASAPWGPATVDHPGFDVEPVDTTGAGDAFTAGTIAALSDGEPLPDAIAFANAVAAVATTAEGAMTALPDRAAVRAFRERQRE